MDKQRLGYACKEVMSGDIMFQIEDLFRVYILTHFSLLFAILLLIIYHYHYINITTIEITNHVVGPLNPFHATRPYE